METGKKPTNQTPISMESYDIFRLFKAISKNNAIKYLPLTL